MRYIIIGGHMTIVCLVCLEWVAFIIALVIMRRFRIALLCLLVTALVTVLFWKLWLQPERERLRALSGPISDDWGDVVGALHAYEKANNGKLPDPERFAEELTPYCPYPELRLYVRDAGGRTTRIPLRCVAWEYGDSPALLVYEPERKYSFGWWGKSAIGFIYQPGKARRDVKLHRLPDEPEFSKEDVQPFRRDNS